MDLFMEHIVQHKRTGKDLLVILGILAAACILFTLSTLMFNFPIVAGFWPLAAAAIIYFTVMFIKRTSLEYEYILTNNELDIDRIVARSSRRRVITVNFTSIDICAPVSHNTFGKTDDITKTFDCTGNGGNTIYFVDFTDEKGKARVIFEPPVSFIENVKRFNPSKIFVD